MKPALILIFVLGLTGCTTSSTSVGGGYYLKTTHYFSSEPPGSSESLYFRGPHGSAKVWKNFTGPLVVEGGTAVFVGTTQPGEYELFAVKNGGTRLEVGKPILALQAERESTDISAFVDEHQIFTWSLKKLTNGFELEYSRRHGVNNPHEYLSLTWAELSTIMHHVEAEGRLQKDRSGFSYLQIDYARKR
jgi:hypothetical protein